MSDFSKAVLTHRSAAESFPRRVGGVLKRCWLAYMDWRLQQLALSRLRCMSDRELKDIGLIRSQIKLAVRGSAEPPILGWRFF